MASKKIILIITINGDISTDGVIDWLSYHNRFNILRWNIDTDPIRNLTSPSLCLGNFSNELSIIINEEELHPDNVHSIWFRKFLLPNYMEILNLNKVEASLSHEILTHLKNENKFGLLSIFDTLIQDKKVLGKYKEEPTKMEMLKSARDLGISIPNTLITTRKCELVNFLKFNKHIITKPIKEGALFAKHNEDSTMSYGSTFTEIVDENTLKKINDHFMLSLFQEKLDKEIEIRSFYLDGKFYSCAIFSQLDSQTDVDFRMYNETQPNRTVPYQLPEKHEIKFRELMNVLGLQTGSLDIVKTKDGKYVFLEVNPSGQYAMVSHPCNYNLDKKIADYLA